MNNLRRLSRYCFLGFVFLYWLFPARLLAASIIPNLGGPYTITQKRISSDPNNTDYNIAIAQIWGRILDVIFVLFGGLAVIVLIYAGIQYITAGSSPEKAKKARSTIVQAVIAIAILTATYSILHFLISLVSFFAV